MFDPSQHKPDPSKRGPQSEYLTQPGHYLLVFVRAKTLNSTPKGSPFKAFKTIVIAACSRKGDVLVDGRVGAFFWHDVFFSPGALSRLGALCASMGVSDPFDVEDDDAIEGALLFAPFKGRVECRKSGDKTYSKVAFTETEVSPAEQRALDEWTATHSADARAEAAVSGGKSGGSAGKGSSDPMPTDDDLDGGSGFDQDIPF